MRSLRSFWRDTKARIVRDPMSPDAVAGGWALGMFIGCSVPFGLQLIVSVPLALMMKVSKAGAVLGTFITNPATIFFIYPAQTWAVYNLLFGSRAMGELPSEWTRQSVMAMSGPVILSFFLGGLALGIVLSPITFFAVRHIVVKYRSICRKKGNTQLSR
ncbi:MAG: DUF2062 domain-containing protein [Kiritimatiellae bacterium]|nr:DUF2062 domain-containing protein [Kiritimatiellia bacterium]